MVNGSSNLFLFDVRISEDNDWASVSDIILIFWWTTPSSKPNWLVLMKHVPAIFVSNMRLRLHGRWLTSPHWFLVLDRIKHKSEQFSFRAQNVHFSPSFFLHSLLFSAVLFGTSHCWGETVFFEAAKILKGLMRGQFSRVPYFAFAHGGLSVRPLKINAALANERSCALFNKSDSFYIVIGLDLVLHTRCSSICYK